MGRLLVLCAGLLCAGSALAEVSVYSTRPEAVSLTIYREGIALVTETRRVELPATPVTLVLQGVVESLLPRSTVMDGAGRALAETDFRFDRLTPASLLQRSVGQVVTLVQTSALNGAATLLQAIVESADRGVVLRSVEGSEALYCSGQPQSLEFSRIPDGLTPTPTLSVRLAGGTAGMDVITGGNSAVYGSGAMGGIVNVVLRQELGDYQLYRLPWPTDLNAQQTKQVAFLDKQAVKVERFYSLEMPLFGAEETEPGDTPNVTLRWQNKRSAGLGEPLPAGQVRVFEPHAGGTVFAGGARLADLPVGLPAEIDIARAMDLGAESKSAYADGYDESNHGIYRINTALFFINQKDVPVRMEVRLMREYDYSSPEIVHSTLRARPDKGDLLWCLKIPAGGTKSLRYELKVRESNE